jgi:hypothetical protein
MQKVMRRREGSRFPGCVFPKWHGNNRYYETMRDLGQKSTMVDSMVDSMVHMAW